jgi:hypothetical protein
MSELQKGSTTPINDDDVRNFLAAQHVSERVVNTQSSMDMGQVHTCLLSFLNMSYHIAQLVPEMLRREQVESACRALPFLFFFPRHRTHYRNSMYAGNSVYGEIVCTVGPEIFSYTLFDRTQYYSPPFS